MSVSCECEGIWRLPLRRRCFCPPEQPTSRHAPDRSPYQGLSQFFLRCRPAASTSAREGAHEPRKIAPASALHPPCTEVRGQYEFGALNQPPHHFLFKHKHLCTASCHPTHPSGMGNIYPPMPADGDVSRSRGGGGALAPTPQRATRSSELRLTPFFLCFRAKVCELQQICAVCRALASAQKTEH